ncbi:hypothetical protein BGZ76_009353 [Entomortierella beljakovae]|nr:hypothetical protein BGZ76_009353 [Entomortierella beljakovae]
MYLLAEFRILEAKPLLPSVIATPHNQNLFTDFGGNNVRLNQSSGGVILQILEIQDIGISSLKMLEACEAIGVTGDQPGGFLIDATLPKYTITLDLTDGVRKMKAILMEPIPGIAMEMKLGAKIRVRDVFVRHGILQLDCSNTFLLGGEVASMNQHPRRLAIMNQMKKKLGLPLDILPGSGNIDPSHSISTATPTSGAIRTISNDIENNTNNASYSNNRSNPVTTVKTPDSVVSTTLFKNSNRNVRAASSTVSNPWQSFKPVQRSASPEQNFRNERDEYMRMLEEEQPRWGFQEEMDIDLGRGETKQDTPSDLSTDNIRLNMDDSIKESNSDGFNDGTSIKKEVQTRRTLSLKSPHTRQQGKRKADSMGHDTSIYQENERIKIGDNKWRIAGSDTSRRTSPSGDDIDVMGSQLEDSNFDTPYLMDYDSNTDNMWVGSNIQKESSPRPEREDNAERNKRRVSPEYEYDHIASRRRSRPFSPQPQPQPNTEYEQIKIKSERESDMLVHVKSEVLEFDNVPVTMVERKQEGKPSDQINESSDDMVSYPIKSEEKTAVELNRKEIEARSTDGASYRAAIELLSDDEDSCIGNGKAQRSNKNDMPEVEIIKVKSESNTGPFKSTQSTQSTVKTEQVTTNGQNNISEKVHVKQEVTLMEFDMDDDFEFSDITEVVKMIPEVGLEEIDVAVQDGREVKAQARVHKLGKFSLTTLAVSIPVTLLPAIPSVQIIRDEFGNSQVVSRAEFKVDAILDQVVVESLLDCSIHQFRDLVRSNESEAKKAVGKLRLNLSEAEIVECHFKGLRTNIPVIRDLKILSKKHKPS